MTGDVDETLLARNLRMTPAERLAAFETAHRELAELRSLMPDGGPAPVLVASIDDLIAMKRETDRPKDRDDIERLEALARLSRRLSRETS